MPYVLHWYNDDHNILQLDIDGDITWDGFYVAIDQICDELKSSSQELDIIFNVKVNMPKGNPMPHIKSAMKRFEQYENLGHVINVSTTKSSFFEKSILEVMTRVLQLTNGKYGFKSSLQEAIDYVETNRKACEN